MRLEHPLRILWTVANVGPYHDARFSLLGRETNVRLSVVEVAPTQRLYPWSIVKSGLYRKHTLFTGVAFEDVGGMRTTSRLLALAAKYRPDVFVLGGYSQSGDLALALAARSTRHVALTVSETTESDRARAAWKEKVKGQVVSRLFDGVFTSGIRSENYLRSLGVSERRIQRGYSVVDNRHFAGVQSHADLNLPDHPYFLTVARFAPEKNLFTLLDAYELYAKRASAVQKPVWPIVLCGSGPLDEKLRQRAAIISDGNVIFPGFMGYAELPEVYQRAGCFILPSTSEPWGLVVNEAMAAGSPVLVSERCGCAPDLVRKGQNGFTFSPDQAAELAELMFCMSGADGARLNEMGHRSQEVISEYSPESWARNFLELVNRSQAQKKGALELQAAQ